MSIAMQVQLNKLEAKVAQLTEQVAEITRQIQSPKTSTLTLPENRKRA